MTEMRTDKQTDKRTATAILAGGGFNNLEDVLDLDRDAIARIPGMTETYSDELLSFLSSITESEDGSE